MTPRIVAVSVTCLPALLSSSLMADSKLTELHAEFEIGAPKKPT